MTFRIPIFYSDKIEYSLYLLIEIVVYNSPMIGLKDQNLMELKQYIFQQTGLDSHKVQATVNLLLEDCTIPFIARYRKDKTGNLDEVEILSIKQSMDAFKKIEKRKQSILEQLKEGE